MSDTAATIQQAATAAPENATIQGQLGPNITGSGSMTFPAGMLYLFFSPGGVGEAQVLYGNNFQRPTVPLQPNVWTPIQVSQGLNLDFGVQNGGDLKLVFAR